MAGGSTFGVELRRARLAAGMSLADLSQVVHYSKGHLSKLENGAKLPTRDLALRCDAATGAGGRLTSLGPSQPIAPPPAGPIPTPAPLDGTLVGDDKMTLELLTLMFHQSRELGRIASPRLVLPTLVAQTNLVRELAALAPASVRMVMLTLAARYAEFLSWMVEEVGDEAEARWWTDEAMKLATEAGAEDVIRYGFVRQAEFCLRRRELSQALDLLDEALGEPTTARVTGLALQVKAQVHAYAGDREKCEAAMAAATDLLAAPDETGTALGAFSAANQHALVMGSCLLALGRPGEAAELLDRELPLVPPHARRVAARFGTTRAISYAAIGDPDAAIAFLPELLALSMRIDSATVRQDLKRLHRELSRWDFRPAVASARTDIAAVLNAS